MENSYFIIRGLIIFIFFLLFFFLKQVLVFYSQKRALNYKNNFINDSVFYSSADLNIIETSFFSWFSSGKTNIDVGIGNLYFKDDSFFLYIIATSGYCYSFEFNLKAKSKNIYSISKIEVYSNNNVKLNFIKDKFISEYYKCKIKDINKNDLNYLIDYSTKNNIELLRS